MFGVRMERNRHGTSVERTRLLNNGRKNLAVTPVDAVEIADCGHGWTKARRYLSKRAEDRGSVAQAIAHRLTGTVSPSWASAMPDGSARLVSSWPRSWAI